MGGDGVKKPRYAMRERLLQAMRGCPTGKTLQGYAAELCVSRESLDKAATLCRDFGQVVCRRAGRRVLWTAAEHAESLAAGCDAEIQRQRQRLADSGVLDARREQALKRRRENQKKRRKAKAAPIVVQGPARYHWPQASDWTPPVWVPSVWALAEL